MNKTHILCILAAFVIGFVFGKSLSIYQIERGTSSGSVQIALKVQRSRARHGCYIQTRHLGWG